MNIDSFKPTALEKTSLHYFLEFVKSIKSQDLPPFIKVKEEDWDNMCGITLVQNLSTKTEFCFNFYNDGELRGIIDDNCE